MGDFKSNFWADLERDLVDPEFKAEFNLASARIRMLDQLINQLDQSRVEQALTKTDLARMLSMQPSNVRRLFSAENPNPTAATLLDVAMALGYEIKLTPIPKTRRAKLQAVLTTQSA